MLEGTPDTIATCHCRCMLGAVDLGASSMSLLLQEGRNTVFDAASRNDLDGSGCKKSAQQR